MLTSTTICRFAPSRFLLTLSIGFLVATLPTAAEPGLELDHLTVAIDEAHVLAGETTFQILREGRAVGQSVIETRLADDAIVIHETSTVEPDLGEDVEMRLHRATFAPLSAEIRGHFQGSRIEADFRFEDHRVMGKAARHPANGDEPTELPVDMAVPPGTFLRGSALALLPAMPLAEGESFELHWFNPTKTIVARIRVAVTGVEDVTVPAGTFESYRIEQHGDVPAMIFHVSTQAPRKIVRAEAMGESTVLQLMP